MSRAAAILATRKVALHALTSGDYRQRTDGALESYGRHCARGAISMAVRGDPFSSVNIIFGDLGLTAMQADHAWIRLDYYNDVRKEQFPVIARRLAKYFRACDRYNAERVA